MTTTQTTTTSDLTARREVLAAELGRCDLGAFPGSKAARRTYAAEDAIRSFDAAHPDIIESVRAQSKAERVQVSDESAWSL